MDGTARLMGSRPPGGHPPVIARRQSSRYHGSDTAAASFFSYFYFLFPVACRMGVRALGSSYREQQGGARRQKTGRNRRAGWGGGGRAAAYLSSNWRRAIRALLTNARRESAGVWESMEARWSLSFLSRSLFFFWRGFEKAVMPPSLGIFGDKGLLLGRTG